VWPAPASAAAIDIVADVHHLARSARGWNVGVSIDTEQLSRLGQYFSPSATALATSYL